MSSGLVVTLAASLVAAAVVFDGQAQAEVELNDSGVWVTNASTGMLGRFNTQSQAIDGTLLAGSTDFDVQQQAQRVLLTDAGTSSASPVDPAHVELGGALHAPKGALVASGGSTAAVLDPERGRLWVLSFDAVGSFDEEKTKPVATIKGGGALAVSQGGTVFVAAPAQHALYTVPTGDSGTPGEVDRRGLDVEAGAEVEVTTVGDDPVVLDRSGGRLLLPGGDAVALADARSARLQQPGGKSDHVLVATGRGLVTQPLGGGDAQVRAAEGTPAAPVQLGGCAYGAWSSTGRVLRDCAGSDHDVDETLDGLGPDARLEYRVNRDAIVLNDLAAGTLWMAAEDFRLVDDWDQKKPEDVQGEESESDEATPEQVDQLVVDRSRPNRPPVAKDDSLGARPGRTTVLDVLGNDVDPDGDVIAATLAQAPTRPGVELQRIMGGAALQAVVDATASGSYRFTYRVDDGRGKSDEATVTLAVTPDGQNAQPVQTGKPVLRVARGGTASIKVLPYFRDPDGDPLLLSSATATVKGDQVRFQPDGTVELRDGGGSTGRKIVDLTVADGLGMVVEGQLLVDVLAGQSPPVAVGDHVLVPAGEPVTVHPLANDSDPDGDALRLVGVGDAAPADITPNLDAGEFTFTSPDPGAYDVTYQVSDGPTATTGLVRVDVLAPAQAQGAPVVVADQALVPTGGSTLVDVLANDTDPAGGVLVVQSVDVPADAGVTVAVLAHKVLRITEVRRLDQPAIVHYTVSNGTATATGEVRVVPVPAPTRLQPPSASPDEVTVHAGDVVTIPVLRNDTHPDGLPLELVPDLVETPDPATGEAFVSGDVVRFHAGSKGGTAYAVYAVTDPHGQKDSAQITVHVRDNAENTPPRPPDVEARVLAGATVRVDLPLDGVDPDGDSVTLTGVASPPSQGTARLVDGFLEYEAGATSAGGDTFTYGVEDARGAVATGTVRVGIARPAAGNHAPVTTDDELTVRPGRTVAIPATDNDSDPDGDRIGLVKDALEGAVALDAKVHGDDVVITSPDDAGTVSFYYGVQDPFGARASGAITVTTSATAPQLRPVAQDDVLSREAVYGHRTVDVDVRANDSDPDGTADALEVSSEVEGVRVTDGGHLMVPVTAHRQVVTYTVTDVDGLTAQAFVQVPGAPGADGRPLPALRPGPPLEVTAGEPLRLDLARLVMVGDGRSPRLTEERKVKAVEGTAQVTGPQSLTYTADAGYAGPAAVTFEVTDGSGPDDPDGLKALLTQPITVVPAENQPPVLTAGSVQVAAGEESQLDLSRLATDPDGDPLTFTAAAGGKGVTVTVEGSTLHVQAEAGVAKGTSELLTFTAADPTNAAVEGKVRLDVVASTRPLVRANPDTVADAHQGEPVTVDVLRNDTNPFPGQDLHLLDAVVETGQVEGSTSVSGGVLAVTPASDFVGVMVVRYRVGDATGDPDREVEGRATITVLGRPEPPTTPHVEEVRSHTVVLSWDPPADNGSPITSYTVTSDQGTAHECGTTTCTLDGLTNDVRYHFTVVAHNDVGESDPSPASAEARPDERPDPPAAPTLVFGDQSLTVSWTNKTYTDRSAVECVNLEISPAPASGAIQQECVSSPVTWTGLTNGTAYKVRVQARNQAPEPSDWGEWSADEVPAGLPDQPAAPTTTNAETVIGGQLTLSWTAPFENGDKVATYWVDELQDGVPTRTIEVTGGATTTTVSGLDKASSYSYSVTAENKAGKSAASALSNATVPSGTPDTLGAPSAARTGAGAIQVAWNAPGSFNGGGGNYNVYQDGALIRSGLTGTAVDVSGLTPTSTYTFTVEACNAQRCGAQSAASAGVVPFTTPGAPQPAWHKQGAQDGYFSVAGPSGDGGAAVDQVEWRLFRDGSQTNSGTATSWPFDVQVSPGYSITFRLEARAHNAAGWSGWATASGTTDDPPAPRAWVTHGSTAVGQTGCSSSGCAYYTLNTSDFPAGSHDVECWSGTNPDASGWHNIVDPGSGKTRSLPANGSVQLTCYYGYLGTQVAVRIDGTLYEPRVW
ncbi:Ig-like domain-containing protein [Xylanimonas sp. McL0601]|uniref:Ig-like domain-containing protein n=1 Tax=Xylanimonas sp. McL0601 TaxID=3414739 RepID=UPI003CEC8268